MKKLPYLILFCTIILSSCDKKQSTEEIVSKYIYDTLCVGKTIKNIQFISSFDTITTDIYNNPSYEKVENRLYENSSKLDREISDYHYERALGGKGINKDLIKLYQEFIREDLIRLKELKKAYIPKFKGFGCYAKIMYETDFGDSIAIGKFCLSPEKNKVLDAEIYSIPISLNIDSIIELDRMINKNEYDALIDTTNFMKL